MKTIEQYIVERDMQGMAGPTSPAAGPGIGGPTSVTPPGETQDDPMKPTGRVEDLMAALRDIISTANKALDDQDGGLGDEEDGDEDAEEDDSMNNMVTRPKSDSPEGMFGQQ